MSGLIRSAQPHQLRRGRAQAPASIRRRMLREFGLPPRCLDDADLKIPIDAVRAPAGGVGGAQRRRGVRPPDGRGATAFQPRTARPARSASSRRSRLAVEALRALRAAPQRGVAADDRGSRRRRRAARGADRRPRGTRPAVDGARDRRRLPDAAHAPRPDWRPRRVCFAHDAPADRSVHERLFGRNVEFGHDFNGIVCARGDLDAAESRRRSRDGEVSRSSCSKRAYAGSARRHVQRRCGSSS